jgi:hypothetical protein
MLYWQTISSYPQLEYGTQPYGIITDHLYSWTINIKDTIQMGIQNKKLYILFYLQCNFESSANPQAWYRIKNYMTKCTSHMLFINPKEYFLIVIITYYYTPSFMQMSD